MPFVHDARIHAGREPGPRAGGEFVLYWMQAAFRADDNIALNFAVQQGDRLRLPVLVYHGLRADYPWASDRLHTFILEGVADLQARFAERGIQYAFYLDTRSPEAIAEAREGRHDPSPLEQLARRAALVVTDFLPTFIHPRQIRRLREKVETPVIAVDGATVVPMALISREHPTARGFRTEVSRHLDDHLRPVGHEEPALRGAIDLPFAPVTVTREGIPALVACCAVDHAVAPSPTLTGGSVAARRRLAWFLEHGLPRYADERNDPNVDATSRLSAYLHFGMISPQEVLLRVREAGPARQAERFLDEALVWREVSHNFCYYQPRHRTVEGIPAWARAELERHEGDPRRLYAAEDLEFARTEDELWNACQRALLRDGELHNYLRMLWGKALLPWTRNAAEALRILEHLNNKYALDGRDPNSYGGIHWTFGRFDRPFYRRPVYGTVRYQSTRAAAAKFDVPAYLRRYGEGQGALGL